MKNNDSNSNKIRIAVPIIGTFMMIEGENSQLEPRIEFVGIESKAELMPKEIYREVQNQLFDIITLKTRLLSSLSDPDGTKGYINDEDQDDDLLKLLKEKAEINDVLTNHLKVLNKTGLITEIGVLVPKLYDPNFNCLKINGLKNFENQKSKLN